MKTQSMIISAVSCVALGLFVGCGGGTPTDADKQQDTNDESSIGSLGGTGGTGGSDGSGSSASDEPCLNEVIPICALAVQAAGENQCTVDYQSEKELLGVCYQACMVARDEFTSSELAGSDRCGACVWPKWYDGTDADTAASSCGSKCGTTNWKNEVELVSKAATMVLQYYYNEGDLDCN
jgi:hypothetical protein